MAEVIGAMAARWSDGFTRLTPSLLSVVGVVSAYVLLSKALKMGMPIGVAYGIWAGAGVVVVALLGKFVLQETLSPVQIVGIIFVVGGVIALEFGGTHE